MPGGEVKEGESGEEPRQQNEVASVISFEKIYDLYNGK